MSLLAQWIHLLNLALPAGLTAICLVLLTPILVQKPRFAYRFVLQALIIFTTGLSVSWGGLYLLGQDGKMATYAVMVVAMGCVQSLWVLRLKRF